MSAATSLVNNNKRGTSSTQVNQSSADDYNETLGQVVTGNVYGPESRSARFRDQVLSFLDGK